MAKISISLPDTLANRLFDRVLVERAKTQKNISVSAMIQRFISEGLQKEVSKQ